MKIKTKLSALLCALAMLAGTVSVLVFAADGWDEAAADKTWYSDGETSFTITSAAQLAGFAQLVNGGNTFAGKTVALAENIDLGGKEWTPIGQAARSGKTIAAGGHAFAGVFDGGEKTISGLKITQGGTDDAIGLFGAVQGGTVKNVTVAADINVPASENAGAIVGLLLENTTVEGCTVSGNVSAKECGGIAGRMIEEGTIRNCTNSATVTGSQNAAGIMSKAYYTANDKEMNVENCANNGSIEATGYHAGGIVAFSAANVKDCTNTKPVVTTGNTAGGIVAEQTNCGTISGCKNSGAIQGKSNAAGIVGWVRYQNNAAAYQRSSTVVVSGNNNSANITNTGSLACGGIVGNAFNRVEVTGNENTAASIIGTTFAAGVVGTVQPNTDNLFFNEQSYAVTNNISTTAIENITGGCKDLYVYNNVADKAVITGNTAGYLAQVGEQKYATLPDAFNAAESGQTITLLGNVAIGESIEIAKDVTLNLNGYKITNNVVEARLFNVTAPVKFTVDGTTAGSGMEIPDGKAYGFIKIDAVEADVTLNGGTYTGNTANGAFIKVFGSADAPAPEATVTLNNVTATTDKRIFNMDSAESLKLTVKGGNYITTKKVENKDDMYSVFGIDSYDVTCPLIFEDVTIQSAGGACVESAGGAATYTNCNFTVSDTSNPAFTASAVACSWGGNVTINSGSYISAGYGIYVYSSGGTITVKDGIVKGGTAAARADASYQDSVAVINIEGGNFEGELQSSCGPTAKKATMVISSGTFTKAVPAEYCALGFAPKDNGDGTFGVAEVKNQISADVVDAVITEAEGVQTGIIRFITKVDKLTDTPESFGTYMIPLFVFEKEESLDAAAVVTYTGEEIQAGQTYSADLTGVPADYLDRPIYAQSFMNFAGENALMCKFTETSVNDVAK